MKQETHPVLAGVVVLLERCQLVIVITEKRCLHFKYRVFLALEQLIMLLTMPLYANFMACELRN